jgi:uncharacterized membrane protein YoaK (UPF0700 family)
MLAICKRHPKIGTYMAKTSVIGPADKVTTALVLTCVGGFVDAVGYISLHEVFTANMSGNSIHVGIGLGSFDPSTLGRFACAIVSYVTAMILTRIAVEMAARSALQRIASLTLALEVTLLLAFTLLNPAMRSGQVVDQSSVHYFGLIAILAFSMGVQTATMTHLGALNVYTTFVTGTLTKFSESFTRALFWAHDRLNSGTSLSAALRQLFQQDDALASALLLSVWLCYIGGAALGTFFQRNWEIRALYLPIAVLVALIFFDRIRPIADKEELHQNQSIGQA